MSDTIPIADHLLTRGRLMLRLGRLADARRLLRRLLVQPNLTTPSRVEAHRLLADIDLSAGRFRRARRLLTAAIRLCRHSVELYVDYARAVEADPNAAPRLAVKALRRAVGIDPFDLRSWSALGTAAMRAGDDVLARKAFRRAARLRPESIDELSLIVDGFHAIGCDDDARKLLAAARFRSPTDRGVLELCNRFRFATALRQQQKSRRAGDEPTILSFPVREHEPASTDPRAVILRADSKSASRPHMLRLIGRQSDPRRAQ